MTINTLLDDYYTPLKQISDRTLYLYRQTIARWRDFLGREPTLDDLEELTVARFLAHRVRSRCPGTAAKDRAQIRALWEFASRRKLRDTWPTIPTIIVPERIPVAWLTEDLQKLMDAAGREQTVIAGIPAALFWRALLMLCYDSGERIGAVMSLRWRQFGGANVIFQAENRKGRRRDIFREISLETAEAMLAIRGNRDLEDLVFPWPHSPTYLWTRLSIIQKRAGLPAKRADKFHRIRKTTASYAEAAGLSAQRLLDHASPATTRRYLDPRIVKTRSAPEVLPKVS